MRTKPFASLAWALTAVALILPACGGDDSQDPAESAPADDLQVLERRVGAIERQLRDLRQAIKSQDEGKRSSSAGPGGETATENAADQGGAPAPEGPGDGVRRASVSGSAADGGAGAQAAEGSGSGSAGGSDGGSDAGGGPDPGTSEDDPSVEDICGPNPAPEC